MNKDQAVVLATGICKFAAGALTAHGLTTDASLVNSQDTIGLVAYLILAGISHWYNKSDSPAPISSGNFANPSGTSGIGKSIGCAVFFLLPFISQAQEVPQIFGQTIVVNGQSFLVTTNSTGGLEVYTQGVQGTNIVTVPATPQQAMEAATAIVANNVPSETNFYGAGEIVARLGAGYLQSSGQAVAFVDVTKYGLLGYNNFGLGIGTVQGQNNGASGTAAFFVKGVYRKPIGNVAFEGGGVLGYDNWNKTLFGGATAGLEYRTSAHLGGFLDYDYYFEKSGNQNGGSLITAGIEYVF